MQTKGMRNATQGRTRSIARNVTTMMTSKFGNGCIPYPTRKYRPSSPKTIKPNPIASSERNVRDVSIYLLPP